MLKEIFISNDVRSTSVEALKLLDEIRAQHPDWVEDHGYVEQKTDGWHAVIVRRIDP